MAKGTTKGKPRRGRPKKLAVEPTPEIAEEDTLSSRDAREETRDTSREETGRRKRVPLGTPQAKLHAEKRPGYVRYWFNDKPGRIEAARNAGYQFVMESGDQKRRLNVGTNEAGQPLEALLMEIPEEFYKEDQALKQVPLDEFEAAINGGVPQGAEARDAGQFYSEAEGTAIQR